MHGPGAPSPALPEVPDPLGLPPMPPQPPVSSPGSQHPRGQSGWHWGGCGCSPPPHGQSSVPLCLWGLSHQEPAWNSLKLPKNTQKHPEMAPQQRNPPSSGHAPMGRVLPGAGVMGARQHPWGGSLGTHWGAHLGCLRKDGRDTGKGGLVLGKGGLVLGQGAPRFFGCLGAQQQRRVPWGWGANGLPFLPKAVVGASRAASVCPPPCLGASRAACVSPPLYPGTSRTVCVSPPCPQHPAFYPRDPTGDQRAPSALPVHPQCAPSVPPACPQHGGGCTKAVRTPQQLRGSRSQPLVPDVPRPGLVLGGQHQGAGMAGTGGGTRPALLGGLSGTTTTTTATAAPPATGPVPPRLHPRPAPARWAL